MMFSLIATARLNDVDPQAWLADVLDRIAGQPIHSLDELLPWNCNYGDSLLNCVPRDGDVRNAVTV